MRRRLDRSKGGVAEVLCYLAAHLAAVEKAKELGVWLVESLKERTPIADAPSRRIYSHGVSLSSECGVLSLY